MKPILAPDALLLDMDGVLADVEASYRACIVETARRFGASVSRSDVLRATLEGDANNDWILTERLLAARGVRASLEEITRTYQSVYLGSSGQRGLRENERLMVPRAVLQALAARLPIGVVTGRPRAEAEWFLERAGIDDLVKAVVCLEDAPCKPNPAPVRLAMDKLGVRRAWMVGDTPDDARAATAAGVLAIGIPAPAEDRAAVERSLLAAGAVVVIDTLADLLELLS
jgi:HAD superfamily hydrolase (TIGR01548 family)